MISNLLFVDNVRYLAGWGQPRIELVKVTIHGQDVAEESLQEAEYTMYVTGGYDTQKLQVRS